MTGEKSNEQTVNDEKNKTNMRIVGKNKELLRRYVQGKYGNI